MAPRDAADLTAAFLALEAAWPLLRRRFPGRVPFGAARAAVESSSRRAFTHEHLRVLLHVFPRACSVSVGPGLEDVFLEANAELCLVWDSAAAERRRSDFNAAVIAFTGGAALSLSSASRSIKAGPADPLRLSAAPVFMAKRRALDAMQCCDENNKAPGNVTSDEVQTLPPPPPRHQEQQQHPASKRPRLLKGLPAALIAQVQERADLERQLAPDALLSRLRAQARASLPSFLDMMHLHFRAMRMNKCELEKLVRSVVERRGPCAYPAVASHELKLVLVREQLQMLLEMLPEWCSLQPSKVHEGVVLFCVDTSDSVSMPALRARVRLGST
jgi:hypothetical protein